MFRPALGHEMMDVQHKVMRRIETVCCKGSDKDSVGKAVCS